MVYLRPKFGDVYAEFKGVMDDNIAKNGSKILVVPTALTTKDMTVKFFTETILLFKVDSFEGFLNWYKIDRMVNDNSSSCNSK